MKDRNAKREYDRQYRKSAKYKEKIKSEEYRARRAEQARQFRLKHPGYDKTNSERCKRYRIRHSAELVEKSIRYNKSHPEAVKANKKRWYVATCLDPDRYARMLERNRRYYLNNREEILAKKRDYVKSHKRKMRRIWRFSRDKMKMMFRELPELWAIYRAKQRDYRKKWLRRRKGVKSPYRPRISNRIPDTCSWGRVLDRRSVFLWNNLPAASLLAGRAFKNMQWRDVHCDRFGEVCR